MTRRCEEKLAVRFQLVDVYCILKLTATNVPKEILECKQRYEKVPLIQ